MKSTKPYTPTPSGTLRQTSHEKDALIETIAHHVLKTNSKFNYRIDLGELMPVYITCRHNIGYAITTIYKTFSELFFLL